MYKKLLIAFLFCTNYLICFSQNDLVPPNESEYITSLPIEESISILCKTYEGRQRMIANLDSIRRRDLKFQWEGAKLQNEPTEATFEEFLDKKFEKDCSSRG